MPPNLKNIQGDIWPRLPKKHETFLFFEITNVAKFKEKLNGFSQYLTSAHTAYQLRGDIYRRKANGELLRDQIIYTMAVNIAFSAKGLKELGKDDLGDDVFKKGMYNDMVVEGLDREDEWHAEFKGSRGEIHGVFILAASTEAVVQDFMAGVLNPTFKDGPAGSVRYLFTQTGDVLPHDIEHFGWADGVSQPLIKGLDERSDESRAPPAINPGIILVGADGDTEKYPAWAKEGSFMVFRRLKQLVPESIQWVVETFKPQATNERGELMQGVLTNLSSRLMGRWPDGVSLEQKPMPDDVMTDTATPADGENKGDKHRALMKSNDFDFRDVQWQDKCPFASHIRKTRPRADFLDKNGNIDDTHAIIRRGIPYGPKVRPEETATSISMHDRGLLFVCYQSNLHNGFRQMQKEWSNKVSFPPGKGKNYGGQQPGLDPIVGQWAEDDDESNYANIPRYDDPRKLEKIKLERIVIAEGGEYFFAPSFSGIKELCQ